MTLFQNEMDLSSFVVNSEWALIGVDSNLNSVFYDCCPEPYLDITYTLKLRRRHGVYWHNVIYPSLLISAISFFTLLIPASKSTSRILSIFLLFLLLNANIPKKIPQNSILQSFLSCCYFTILCIFIETVLATAFYHTINGNNKIVQCIAALIFFCGDKVISDEQARGRLTRILDILAFVMILLVFIFGVVLTLGGAPILT